VLRGVELEASSLVSSLQGRLDRHYAAVAKDSRDSKDGFLGERAFNSAQRELAEAARKLERYEALLGARLTGTREALEASRAAMTEAAMAAQEGK
jgi:hypothetical protein